MAKDIQEVVVEAAGNVVVVASEAYVKPCVRCGAQDRYACGRCRPCAILFSTLKPKSNGATPVSTVYGIGSYSRGKFLAWENNKPTAIYDLWKGVLRRCYEKCRSYKNLSYAGCTASKGFTDFQTFCAWAVTQYGFGISGWHLDKDLIFRGNKIYSENTCVFLPMSINQMLTSCRSSRGDYPIGVSKSEGKYTSNCRDGTHKIYLGSYTTEIEAFNVYKEYKKTTIKARAEEYKDQLDPRAYAALMAYEVLITD